MPQPRTCCPVGKIYDNALGICTDLNHLNPTEPIECPCCPPGYFYNSQIGLCVQIANGDTKDPIPCLCCPDGYYYDSMPQPPGYPNGLCRNFLMASDTLPTIPCIDCNCTTPDDPTCTDCGSDGLPVTFAYDPMVKNCTDCDPHDVTNPKGDIQDFLPEQFLDPLTSTFRLRNKNFI